MPDSEDGIVFTPAQIRTLVHILKYYGANSNTTAFGGHEEFTGLHVGPADDSGTNAGEWLHAYLDFAEDKLLSETS